MTQSDNVASLFRAEYGRCVATLIRFLGDFDLAEEAVQEAFVIALERWPHTGTPPNPGGWITTTARNRAIDRRRREGTRDERHAQSAQLAELDRADRADEAARSEDDPVKDDRLRLIFTCCHPALAPTSQVALTLRMLGGLSTPEIARAFLVPEATVAQRIVRAKRKIAGAGIPYRVPSEAELPDRLKGVLSVLYLVFNEGYTASGGSALVREDLCREAIRLARVLVELMPDEPEALGLLALMLLSQSRRPARVDANGALRRLGEQDRARWDRELIAEGHALVRTCLRRNQPGPYQLQAAINAVHTNAAVASDTDWRQILALYDQLLAALPTPVVALNRTIALAEVAGPAAALDVVEALALSDYHLFHATRAELLQRVGRDAEARAAYAAALARTENEAERAFLRQRLAEFD